MTGQPLIKRFYTDVTLDRREVGFALLLDGRMALSKSRNALCLPTKAMGEAVAQEWREQGKHIIPSRMPFTRLAYSALDLVKGRERDVVADIVTYAGSDLLLYRAGHPDALRQIQAEVWDPVLAWVDARFDARFILAEGLMPVTQPSQSLERLCTVITGFVTDPDLAPFILASLHVMTTLSGSALLALAVDGGRLSADEAWKAAHIDEKYQQDVWGEDAEAAERMRKLHQDFISAASFGRMVRMHERPL